MDKGYSLEHPQGAAGSAHPLLPAPGAGLPAARAPAVQLAPNPLCPSALGQVRGISSQLELVLGGP